MYRSISSFTLCTQANKNTDSISNRVHTNFILSSARKYHSLNVHYRNLVRINWRLLPATGVLIDLEFKSTWAISDIVTRVICLRAVTTKRRMHQYVRLCFMSVFMRPRHFLREVAATIRATVSDDTVTAFRISAVAVHALCFVSKGVCNLCAADNPRADDKSFITVESRHGARLLLLSYSLLVPNRTRLHDEYSGESGSFSRERMH